MLFRRFVVGIYCIGKLFRTFVKGSIAVFFVSTII